jgi:hypothetical protein
MKKTMVSLATASLIATGAFAADKGIDIVTNGQAVVWYQTVESNTAGDLFDQTSSIANVGVQLDLSADLKNNFTFGSQVSYIGTLGLENNLVDNTVIAGTADVGSSTADDILLTKVFVAKKIANTTVKLGRQELPKSLSPLAYTEGWNVFKNTFDAVVAVNTDLPKTTIVAAWVGNTTGHTLRTISGINQNASSDVNNQAGLNGGAYMLTAQTTAIPMTTFTATYYNLPHLADAIWLDAKVAPKDAPAGLSACAQYGTIDAKAAGTKETDAFGVKVAAKMGPVSVYAAYSDVNAGSVAARNLGTGDKTPLYTQLVLTEDSASLDAEAITGGVSYSMGDMGTVTARYGMVDVGNGGNIAAGDEAEFDLIYSVKAGGVKYFAAYVNQDRDYDSAAITDTDVDVIRLWARYNF